MMDSCLLHSVLSLMFYCEQLTVYYIPSIIIMLYFSGIILILLFDFFYLDMK